MARSSGVSLFLAPSTHTVSSDDDDSELSSFSLWRVLLGGILAFIFMLATFFFVIAKICDQT
jgi:hypothetical protein